MYVDDYKICLKQEDIDLCLNDTWGETLSLRFIIQKCILNKIIERYVHTSYLFESDTFNLFETTLYLQDINNNSDNNDNDVGIYMDNCIVDNKDIDGEDKTAVFMIKIKTVEMTNCKLKKARIISKPTDIKLENVEIEDLWIENASNINCIKIKNSTIDRLWIYNTIVKKGVLVTYGTKIGRIVLDSSIINNNYKNVINNKEGDTIKNINDVYIEDDFETIAYDRFTMKNSLIINNNYDHINDMPNEDNMYEEWNYKKVFREKDCMMCGDYDSLDHMDDNSKHIVNNLREEDM